MDVHKRNAEKLVQLQCYAPKLVQLQCCAPNVVQSQHNAAILVHRQGNEFRSAPVADKLSYGGIGGNRSEGWWDTHALLAFQS